MSFPYGIARDSLRRWKCYWRIRALQRKRGPEVGEVALSRIVDAELEAIAQATAAEEEREAQLVRVRRYDALDASR